MTPSALSPATTWPRSLAACLPQIWSRILFPGTANAPTRVRWISVLLLLIVPGALLYPRLSFRLLEPDESRYAQIPREMLARGDAVVPHLQGKPYLDKPPMMYWLVMLSYSFLGVSAEAARLIPALAIHGAILLAYFLGRRIVGERAALWGNLFLSVAPGFLSIGRLLILDGLLAFFTLLAILAAWEALNGDRLHRGWWLISALAAGCGILTKGPVILILLAVPLWLFRQLQGSTFRLTWMQLAAFAGALLAVNLPWYVAIGLRQPLFLRYFLWEHNVVRFLAPFDHIRPVWFYLPILTAGLLPGTLLAWWFARFLLTADPTRTQRRTPGFGFLLLAGGWCVLFFSLSGSKLPTYILPAYPFLALALGVLVDALWPRRTVVPAALLALALAALLYVHHGFMPWYARMRSPMGDPDKVARYCADKNQPVFCFPRSCDSVAFYLDRCDLRNTRSKYSQELIENLLEEDRSIVLFTHRHSLESLRYVLPPDLVITEVVSFRRDRDAGWVFDWLAGETPWGLCDLAVIERRVKKNAVTR